MAATKKGGTAKKAVKKAAPKKAAATKKAAPKKAAPKKTKPDTKLAPKAAGTKKPAAKKAAGIKLTPKQVDFLKKIHGAGEGGYNAAAAETRSIVALVEKKLVKKGAKDKATGKIPYMLTKLGTKHASTPVPAGA
jgi:hypothetical protein